MSARRDESAQAILKISVGVMGSAGGNLSREILEKGFRMGQEIARRGCVLITGACPGLPHQAVLGAKSAGGIVVGISPALNFEEHAMKYASPYHGYDAIIYTGSGLMGREIENIRSCDMVVFMGGRSGTLGEFAIAYDEAKVIGVLKGPGGSPTGSKPSSASSRRAPAPRWSTARTRPTCWTGSSESTRSASCPTTRPSWPTPAPTATWSPEDPPSAAGVPAPQKGPILDPFGGPC